MAVFEGLILVLLVFQNGPYVFGDNSKMKIPTLFFKNTDKTKMMLIPNNPSTHVRTKNLSGNVELTSLEVLSTTLGLEGNIYGEASQTHPSLGKSKQVGEQTITEKSLLSEVRTKAPTDGVGPFGFNGTSGTFLDQNITEKPIIDTPLTFELIGEELFQSGAVESTTAELQDTFSGDGIDCDKRADSVVAAKSKNKVIADKPAIQADKQPFLETTEYGTHRQEDFEDLSSFLTIDDEFLKTLDNANTDFEDLIISSEDLSSIFTNNNSVKLPKDETVNFQPNTFVGISRPNIIFDKFLSYVDDLTTLIPENTTITSKESEKLAIATRNFSGDNYYGATVVTPLTEKFDSKMSTVSAVHRAEGASKLSSLGVQSAEMSPVAVLTFNTSTIAHVNTDSKRTSNLTRAEMLITNSSEKPQIPIEIFGKNITSSIKINDEESVLFVPSSASVAPRGPNAINITWQSSIPNLNNSLLLNFRHSIQLNIVKNNQMHIRKIDGPEDKLVDVDSNSIKLGDGTEIYFSNPQVLKMHYFNKNVFQDASPSTPNPSKLFTAEVIGGCVGFALMALAGVYYVVKKIRGRIRNFKPEHDV